MVVQKPEENNQDMKTRLCRLLSESLAHSQTQSQDKQTFLTGESSADL